MYRIIMSVTAGTNKPVIQNQHISDLNEAIDEFLRLKKFLSLDWQKGANLQWFCQALDSDGRTITLGLIYDDECADAA